MPDARVNAHLDYLEIVREKANLPKQIRVVSNSAFEALVMKKIEQLNQEPQNVSTQ